MFNLSRGEHPEKRLPVSDENSKTERLKTLAWMISEPPAAPVKMTITPELAAEMLTYNTSNRPLSKHTVKSYAAQMSLGQWHDTFMPIQFSDMGRLIDGQHRLQAIVDSGCAVSAWVAFGAIDETFAFIDIGKKRGASDIFAIHGVPNPNVVAAAAKWIWSYENCKSSSFSNGGGGSLNPQIATPAGLYDYYMMLDTNRLHVSCRAGGWFATNRMPNPSITVGVHYVCAGKSKAQADAFFEKVATGVGFATKQEPEYKLRDRLTDPTMSAASRSEQAAFTIQAWNAVRTRKKLGKFVWQPGPYPRVA